MNKLEAFWVKVNSDLTELWSKDKFFVVLFSLVILVVKFRSLFVSLLVGDSKNIFDNAQKVDTNLAKQEEAYKTQASELEKPKTEPVAPVTDDWYKNE